MNAHFPVANAVHIMYLRLEIFRWNRKKICKFDQCWATYVEIFKKLDFLKIDNKKIIESGRICIVQKSCIRCFVSKTQTLQKLVNRNFFYWCLKFEKLREFIKHYTFSVWVFLINFIETIDSLLSPSFDCKALLKLKNLIIDHYKKYVELFNDSLRPKHRFLTHCWRILWNQDR